MGGIARTSTPSRSQRLLLEVALLDDPAARAAWRKLRTTLDVDRVEEGTFALLPLLYRRLQRIDPDAAVVPRLHGVYRYVWLRNQVALRTLQDALEALRDRSVESMVVGDAAVALGAYEEQALRQIEALEVAVPAEMSTAAAAALEEAGWQQSDSNRGAALATLRGLQLAAPGGNGSIALRVLLPELGGEARRQRTAELWHTAQELEVGDVSTRAPSAANELLRACLAGAAGSGVRRVQWVADAATILERGDVDWAELAESARRGRLTMPLRAALAYLTRLLPLRVPEWLEADLRTTPTTPRERVAHRVGRVGGTLAGSLPSTLAQYMRLTADEPALAAIAGAARFLRQEWGADDAGELPVVAVRAVRQRMRARRTRHLTASAPGEV